MNRRSFEVLVVGAGPAGSHAARRLAEAGRDVGLVDENEGPRCNVICSGIVSEEAFRRFDLSLDPVVDTIHEASFFSPSGREVLYRPEEPLARVVDRTRFDGILADRAVAAGACLLRGHTATEVQRTAGAVRVTVRLKGDVRTLHARALVVATGYRQRLHGQVGLGKPPRYVQGIHHEIPSAPLNAAEVYFGRAHAPGFFAWAVPFGETRARVGLLARRGGRDFLRRFVASEPHRLRRSNAHAVGHGAVGGPRESDGSAAGDASCGAAPPRSRGIVQGAVTPSVAERVLAVGEAAGQVKTTTGGGLYYGLIGAELAAEVLAAGLRRNRLSASALMGYHKAWMDRLGAELRSGLCLQRLGESLTDGQVEQVFRILQGNLGEQMRRRVRFDWHRSALRLLFGSTALRCMMAQRLSRSGAR